MPWRGPQAVPPAGRKQTKHSLESCAHSLASSHCVLPQPLPRAAWHAALWCGQSERWQVALQYSTCLCERMGWVAGWT